MLWEKFRLDNKVAIVTGSGRGLGKAMALALAEAGADLVVTSRTQVEIDAVAREIQGLGRRAIAVPMDVTKQDDVNGMVAKAVDEFGKIDILVNNSGTIIQRRFLDYTLEDWEFLINTDFRSMFFCSQAVGKFMIEQKSGKIINMASKNALQPRPKCVVFDSIKGAVITFTKALAREWARYNINVNAIAPGYFLTPLVKGLMDQAGVDPKTVGKKFVPLGRLGVPEEMGPLIVYLASSASDYMTGEIIVIDGGEMVE
ncbi:MAG: glucose 1-dehydrogenase [Pseudomonadota bacterium]